jgi:hypothetical protein
MQKENCASGCEHYRDVFIVPQSDNLRSFPSVSISIGDRKVPTVVVNSIERVRLIIAIKTVPLYGGFIDLVQGEES